MNSLIWPFLMIFFLVSCGGKEVKMATPGSFDKARWETKLEFHDVQKDKTDKLNVDVLGERNGPMRMEASAILGIPVASYVMSRTGFYCAVYTSPKTFYEGPLNEMALKPLIHVPLSPVVLSRIAFDEPIQGADWKCNSGSDGFVSDCNSVSKHLKVTWHREDTKRTVDIDGPGYQIHWKFGPPKTDVQFKDQTFHLEPGFGFKVIRL